MRIVPLKEIAIVDISNVDKKTKEGEKNVVLCNFTDVYKKWAITSSMVSNLMIATANQNQIERFSIHKGQVAITKDSETRDDIGIATYIADDIENGVLGYHCALITPDQTQLRGKYLNIVFHSPYAHKYFEANASGSGQRYTLTNNIIESFPVPLPPLEIQDRFGELCSDIDKKIENNNAVCSDLESMAKLLYDYWFIQFDFPDENGKPYKSSGGKMVWNNELKREIPEGWEVASISRIAKVLSGGTPSKTVNEYWYNGKIPFFGPTDYQHTIFQFDTKDHITENGLNACASSLFDVGTIMITARGSIGKLVIVGTPMAMNQSCYAFSPYNITFVPYVYFVSKQVIEHLKVKSTGSVFKSIIIDDIEASLVPIGAENVICKFCKTVCPMFEEVMNLEMENQQLASLRDFLLPMLMNGQVKVC